MRILVVDDEALARSRLRALLDEMGGHEVIGEAETGREALLRGDKLHPDVVLLDIRMPEMDGLEAARHFARLEHPPAIIFTTAYGDHALEAFEAHAVDYLLKPIRTERLAHALTAARQLNRSQLAMLREEDSGERRRTHISARVRGNIELIPVADVRYFQADQKYVLVRHAAGQVLIDESLRALEAEFGDRFVRIHRNALVARDALQGLEKLASGQCAVRLRGIEERLEVSRRHLPRVRELLRQGA